MSSVLVANAIADSAKKIAAVLRTSGLNVGCVCTTGSQTIDFANRHYHGGVIVNGYVRAEPSGDYRAEL